MSKQFLRHLTIFQRLALLIIVVIIGVILQSVVSLTQQYEALEKQQYNKTQSLVENAYSLVAYFHQQYASGAITETQAKLNALDAVAALRYEGDNYFWINDYQPKMVMHPFKPELNGKDLSQSKDPNGKRLFVEMVNVAKASGSGFVPYLWPKPGKQAPVEKISYVKAFTPWGWIVGSGVYLDTIDAEFANIRNLLLIELALLIILLFPFSAIISKSIIDPINQAKDMMKDIAQGEGDLTRTLNESGKDEITALAKYFNLYTEKMRHSIATVAHNAKEVETLANQVKSAGEENLAFIESQNDNSRQVATAAEQMTMQVREISNNADTAEHSATDARNYSQKGKHTISQTIAAIKKLSEQIQSVSMTTSSLDQESQHIGSVLDVIRGIAEQTNLLALNAAIEAARAGEQGRGFAVVADEVRTLASRTGQSTDEIHNMIERLQKEAQQAVAAVKISQQISEQTVEQVQLADTALTEIEKLIDDISDMNTHIAKATDEQSLAAQEVNERIAQLSDSTHHSLDTTHSLNKTSEQLTRASHELSDIVERFKV
ncbi:methyl-accepting chemotaxis protein [Pseudoalteromonas sp. McH1-7]|uniref:Methyl-accepting chemotaxis protein n=1 Tax=Pseudoalteromonas peptidolytica F12-50-A1 TaxID=1315280 RepID=A0A8I0MU81_9GAMM|nr:MULTISPECIES: methyl-accepting chemotaxis protein [Pseudoalteromonas]MBE0345478.1 methyl-accepting chemotaxis protein [Pseudoalteromonas peptidolytica F12-50-A1]MDW7547582.1 methyl-accepting chemotaxis protein [Pseudoalteromonas peptidolytica]NLR13425.1 methyl-accepting chemotaxis protein [Pseudoalteromonas peptidolytica]NUZ09736.1 methyl-accepting chemotaxis protein [Pseudoalteromonas sp. McH1-7]USD27785.1 methyl-accepting chemotaxis protein [Pseudoalteromonas sp. SCSIO 43201]